MIPTVQFRTATVVLTPVAIVTVFADGHINRYQLDEPNGQMEYARLNGYGDDWRTYMIEHDQIHCWVADRLGQPWSYALHDGDGTVPLNDAPQAIKDEEHLVSRLQRWMMLGEVDPYGQVQKHFNAADLQEMAAWLDGFKAIGDHGATWKSTGSCLRMHPY